MVGKAKTGYPPENELAVKRLMELFECETEAELAEKIPVKQPQITRWKRKGLGGSMGNIILAYQRKFQS